ncbi:hypothetical protein C8J57DRAFT_1509169 [Mycena rebaudengoi]|nr:hypothetical protein C8J57DRAFT_1509169 [Mycena rebaudengoi]
MTWIGLVLIDLLLLPARLGPHFLAKEALLLVSASEDLILREMRVKPLHDFGLVCEVVVCTAVNREHLEGVCSRCWRLVLLPLRPHALPSSSRLRPSTIPRVLFLLPPALPPSFLPLPHHPDSRVPYLPPASSTVGVKENHPG